MKKNLYYPILFFLGSRILVLFVVVATYMVKPDLYISEPGGLAWKMWARWDVQWIYSVANDGYTPVTAPFFPFYPLLVRLCGGGIIGGLFLAHLAFLGALVLLYRLVEEEFSEGAARNTILYLSFFPPSFIFSFPYTESVFLLLCVTSFYCAHKRHWFWAAVAGAFAATARLTGILLFPCMLLEYFRSVHSHGAQVKNNILYLLLIPAGLVSFMVFLLCRFDQPLLFVTSEEFWGRSIDFPWPSIVRSAWSLYLEKVPIRFVEGFINLSFALVYLVISLLLIFSFKPSYVLFCVAGVLVPLSSTSLLAMPRFGMVLFPLFIWLALHIKSREATFVFLVLSAVFLVVLTALFEIGYLPL